MKMNFNELIDWLRQCFEGYPEDYESMEEYVRKKPNLEEKIFEIDDSDCYSDDKQGCESVRISAHWDFHEKNEDAKKEEYKQALHEAEKEIKRRIYGE